MDTSTLMAAIAVMKNMPDNAAASAAAAAESAEAAQEVLNNIPQDYTELSDDVSDLLSALVTGEFSSSAWTDICTITAGTGTYKTNLEIGTTVSTTINSSTSFGCQLVEVSEGDTFEVSGTGGNNALLWAFTNTSYELLSKATPSADPQTNVVTAAEDGYLFVNCKTAGGAEYSLKKYITTYAIPNIKSDITAIKGDLYGTYDVNLEDLFVLYKYYNTSGGVGTTVNFETMTPSTSYMSLVDECKAGQQYLITGAGGASPRLWCFVDTDDKIVSVAGGNASETNLTITAPVDGKLIFEVSISYAYAITKLNVKMPKAKHSLDEADEDIYLYTGFDMFRTIAGLGDSYTEGDLVTSSHEWVTVPGINYLSCIAKRNGITANNYGSGGARTDTYLARSAFANCLSDDPSDLYMICFGINDASYEMTIGTVADINDADYTQNPDTFYGNYGKILAQLMAHAPDAKFILIMPWTTDADYTSYNNAVAGIAEHYSIPCINPSDDPFFTSHFWLKFKSGGHPTAMLYSGMGRAVERLFNKCVRENASYFRLSIIG